MDDILARLRKRRDIGKYMKGYLKTKEGCLETKEAYLETESH